MIRNTFMFVPGIGRKTEENFWREGILTWDDLNGRVHAIDLSRDRIRILEDYLDRANSAIQECDASFFAEHLPQREYWRLYRDFADKTAFLDIETTGLSHYYDKITLIGVFDRHGIAFFIRDNNLERIADYLKNYELIVTFNGKLFDIPFIKKEIPKTEIPPIHIDLRYVLRSLGLTGPMKDIEKKMGIKRPSSVAETNGRGAVVLWNKFVNGDDAALEKLLLYNTYDIVDLRSMMEFCYQKKAEQLQPKMDGKPRQPSLFKKPRSGKPDLSLDIPNFGIPDITTQRVSNGMLDIHLNGESLLRIERAKIQRIDVKIRSLVREIEKRNKNALSVGIDLSGSEKRKSGFCILQGKDAHMALLRSDEEIISKTLDAKPAVISIDSPLSLPKGRCCANDSCECRKYGITRECERILKKRGINVYPCLIPSMQKLTMRGIRLAKVFRREKYEVIESYPGAAQDIMGLPRKRVDLAALEIDLMNMGIKPSSSNEVVTHDEIDALTSALVGYFYLAGKYEAIGDFEEENHLIIPDLKNGQF